MASSMSVTCQEYRTCLEGTLLGASAFLLRNTTPLAAVVSVDLAACKHAQKYFPSALDIKLHTYVHVADTGRKRTLA